MDSETNIPKDGDMCIHSFGFVPFRPTQRPASNNRRQYGKRKTIVVTSQRRKKQKRTQDETKRIKKQKWSAQKEWKAEKKREPQRQRFMSDATPAQYYPGHLDWMERFFFPPKTKNNNKRIENLSGIHFPVMKRWGSVEREEKISAFPSRNGTQLVSFCGPGEKLH